jgi:hypothetical protein
MPGRSDREFDMGEKIPSWLAQVISLVLMLGGFGAVAAGVVYQALSGGSPDLLYYLPYVAAFVFGLLVFVWDRQKYGSIPRPTNAESAVLHFRMAIASLGLFVAAVVIAVAWSRVLQGTWLWYWLSVLVGAGLWCTVFSVWGYYKVGGRLAMRETLRHDDGP